MATVLFCGDETAASLATVRALRAAGHEPWIATAQEFTFAARSRDAAGTDRIPDPGSAAAAEVAGAIAELARRRRADVVLPGTQGTLRALTGNEHLFSDAVVGTGPANALERALDKLALNELAPAAGLDCLPAVEVSLADLDRFADELPLPGVAKPRHAAALRPDGRIAHAKVDRVERISDLRDVLESDPGQSWIVQRRVEGTLAAIGGVAWRGRLVCAVHQVSPRIWPPGAGITAFAVTVEPDREREQGVARLLAEIGWSGLFGIQFLLAEGRAYPIDLNPRMYGSIGLAIAAGLNLPAIWTELLLGGDPEVSGYEPGVRYRVEHTDARALWAAFRSGSRAGALRGAMPRRGTAHAVFSLRDPRPATAIAARALARARQR